MSCNSNHENLTPNDMGSKKLKKGSVQDTLSAKTSTDAKRGRDTLNANTDTHAKRA